ncbi:MAG: glucose-6-phosphate isomerase [Burkholderiales bacterium]|nr:glucose-6-phosphate isomerase [Pseudomonadota bacterium]MCC7067204.1 glucose-6-phosphate isomerase [Burkholderiales bacterium]
MSTLTPPRAEHFDPASSSAWQALERHAEAQREAAFRVSGAFVLDPERAQRFTLEAAGLVLDFSKQRIDGDTMRLLVALAAERAIEARRDAMFGGARVNATEGRAALHVALRAPRDAARRYAVDGVDVLPAVHEELDRLRTFSEQLRAGQWRGHRGQAIRDVVNIGIGGSDLGPRMVCSALRRWTHPGLRVHFVANVDGADFDRVVATLDPATTLFIVCSKTFTTQETMLNAARARGWLLSHGVAASDLGRHFVAVTTNLDAAQAFGIAPERCFRFENWVGGRFSLWSAVGLAAMLAVGVSAFDELLAGAHAMDEHFATSPLAQNMPCVLALLDLWNHYFLGAASLCIAPYAEDLRELPAYLQQLVMESNGKSVAVDGTPLTVASCGAVFGAAGTNAQHAYFQWLHQGTSSVAVDFIAPLAPTGTSADSHRVLLANCFAQSEALMRGKSADEVRAELAAAGLSEAAIAAWVPHRCFPGNRPSNTLLLPALSPHSLGALLALYEHKTFVAAALIGINAFDQWGVELGKQLATSLATALESGVIDTRRDASTRALIARARVALANHTFD